MTRATEHARRGGDELGAEIVEFIGAMPWLLLIGLVVWQFMVFGHCMLVTAAAARDGARVAAAWQDASSAVASSIGGAYEFRVQPGGCGGIGNPVQVTVRTKVPIIDIPYVALPEIWTRHTATMRCEPPW